MKDRAKRVSAARTPAADLNVWSPTNRRDRPAPQAGPLAVHRFVERQRRSDFADGRAAVGAAIQQRSMSKASAEEEPGSGTAWDDALLARSTAS